MAKFCGIIGFAVQSEIKPGVWSDEYTEKKFKGDLLKNKRTFNNSDSANGDIKISNIVSIIADPYATQNFQSIRYVKFMGTTWTVTDVEVERPRLLLTLGGVYNG